MFSRSEPTVVIARREHAGDMRERLAFDPAVRVFSPADAEEALAIALQHPETIVALDRRFASSPAGAQLVDELHARHPQIDLRVFSDHGSDVPLLLRRPALPTGKATILALSQPLKGLPRRAPRYPIEPGCEALVNGESAEVVDVSIAGTQLIAPIVLRPTQPVRVAFAEESPIRLHANVAWSRFERSMKTGQTCYRAGLQFRNAEAAVLEEYCIKHATLI